jgi:CheY-like chemotaxis protein
LSEVYGFIKQSGGHIKIYSELGEGTTVRLYLPRLREQPAAVQEVAPIVQAPPLGGQETILVVEDNEEVRAYTTDILRELGYEVFEATEGDTALSLIASEPRIRLLFTDVGLPGPFNGRQIADEARKLRSDLKVLFTTGYAQNSMRDALGSGQTQLCLDALFSGWVPGDHNPVTELPRPSGG